MDNQAPKKLILYEKQYIMAKENQVTSWLCFGPFMTILSQTPIERTLSKRD
jgi:hypothetical protein